MSELVHCRLVYTCGHSHGSWASQLLHSPWCDLCTYLGAVSCKAWKAVFKKYIFFLIMTPIDIRPSPCVTQARHGSACTILLLCIVLFRSLSQTDANATFSYVVDFMKCLCLNQERFQVQWTREWMGRLCTLTKQHAQNIRQWITPQNDSHT